MENIDRDVLIIGQGIAGSLLALDLCGRGYRVMVVDDGHLSSSTLIAGGIINPIVGQRLTRLWPSDEEGAWVREYYREIERRLRIGFLKEYPLVRMVSRPLEFESYHRRIVDGSLAGYLEPVSSLESLDRICEMGRAQFMTSGVMQIDTTSLLMGVRRYLDQQESFLKSVVRYEDIVVTDEGVFWQGIRAKSVVFCEGAKASDNPFFGYLQFKNVSGHIMELNCPDAPQDMILNHGKWMCPMGGETVKYGATSYWVDTPSNREASIRTLMDSASHFLKVPFTVSRLHHGVRPTLHDRRVIAEWHPTLAWVGIITGLGGQGLALAPKKVATLPFPPHLR